MFSVVIPTWNNLDFLKLCVDSLRKYSQSGHEIIIHINDGSDGTLEWVKAQGIKYSHTRKNIGICLSVNHLVAQASHDWVLYMNDDMVACPGWDTAFAKAIESTDTDLALYFSTMIQADNGRNPNIIKQDFGSTPKNFDESRFLQEYLSEARGDVEGGESQPTLFHRKWWAIVGGYSLEFSPGMSSDDDLLMKFWIAGCRHFRIVGSSRFYHFSCKSTGRVRRNKGGRIFVMKWGITQREFKQDYLGVLRTGTPSKLASRHHKMFPRTTLSGRFRRAVYGLLGEYPLRDIELWDAEPGLEPRHHDNSGAILKPPSRILMVVTLRIGDVLLATPVIRSLHQAWPDAKIDVLVFEGTEGVLLRNPDIDRVITVPARPRFWQHLRLILSLLRRYDLALTNLLGDRPTLYTWFAGNTRIGMQDGSKKEHWKRYLLTHWANFEHVDNHTVLTNLGLVDLLGIKRNHEVVVAWNRSDELSTAGALPFKIGEETFAVLHMSPKFTYKMWQRDGWIELAKWFTEKGIRPVLTGSSDPAELAYVDQIYRSMPSTAVNVAGKLSLAESAFLISHAKYYVGPDTALTHMAAALGTPTVALFGPSNPVKWGPWPKDYQLNRNPYQMKGTQRVGNVVLLQGEADCVPCMEEGCERHNDSLSDCLQKLPVSRVIDAIGDLAIPTGKHEIRLTTAASRNILHPVLPIS
jgi:heptosyltransferase-3